MITTSPSHADSMAHQACLYGSDDEFQAMALPFVRAGLAAGEPVLVSSTAANVALLKAGLGSQAAGVDFTDDRVLDYSAPHLLATLIDYLRQQAKAVPEGGRVRVISEPSLAGRSADHVTGHQEIESGANLLFADSNPWFICPYDTRTTPAEVLTSVRQTHPELIAGERHRESDGFIDPHEFLRALHAQPLPEPSGEPPSLTVTTDAALRRFVADHVASLGLTSHQAEMAVVAAHETAAWMRQPLAPGPPGTRGRPVAGRQSASAHTEPPPLTARIWSQSGTPVVDLRQGGVNLVGPIAGYRPPTLEPTPEDGLWLARLISARLDIRRDERSCWVRLRLPSPSDAWLSLIAQ